MSLLRSPRSSEWPSVSSIPRAGIPRHVGGHALALCREAVEECSLALKGSGGCVAYRDRGQPGRVVPPHLEFGAYRQRGKAPTRRSRVSPGRLRGAILCTPDELMGENS